MPDLATILLLGALAATPTDAGEPAQIDDQTARTAVRALARGTRGVLGTPPPLPQMADWKQAFTSRQRDQLERLLGPSRLRRLERARFHLQMSADLPFQELSDKPANFDEVRDTLKGAYLKLVQESLEEKLSIDAFLDRLGERIGADGAPGDGSVRLRISPRLNLGGNGYLGVKLGLRSRSSSLWAHPSLELRQRLEEPGFSIGLKFDDGDRYFLLEHQSDHRQRGESWSLDFRLTF